MSVVFGLATFLNLIALIRFGDLDVEYEAQAVFPSIAFLFFYLAVHLIALGFLSELFLRVSDHRMTEIIDAGGV